jgi:hypothetical protein
LLKAIQTISSIILFKPRLPENGKEQQNIIYGLVTAGINPAVA